MAAVVVEGATKNRGGDGQTEKEKKDRYLVGDLLAHTKRLNTVERGVAAVEIVEERMRRLQGALPISGQWSAQLLRSPFPFPATVLQIAGARRRPVRPRASGAEAAPARQQQTSSQHPACCCPVLMHFSAPSPSVVACGRALWDWLTDLELDPCHAKYTHAQRRDGGQRSNVAMRALNILVSIVDGPRKSPMHPAERRRRGTRGGARGWSCKEASHGRRLWAGWNLLASGHQVVASQEHREEDVRGGRSRP